MDTPYQQLAMQTERANVLQERCDELVAALNYIECECSAEIGNVSNQTAAGRDQLRTLNRIGKLARKAIAKVRP